MNETGRIKGQGGYEDKNLRPICLSHMQNDGIVKEPNNWCIYRYLAKGCKIIPVLPKFLG